jgi:hypothetical protein
LPILGSPPATCRLGGQMWAELGVGGGWLVGALARLGLLP